nr:MAG TPA: hypothetical protein [Caudoviricetes sp.]
MYSLSKTSRVHEVKFHKPCRSAFLMKASSSSSLASSAVL